MPDKDENGNVIEDEFSEMPFPSQHFARFDIDWPLVGAS
jgi:hypothetical protein